MVYNSGRTSKTDPLYIGPCTVVHVNRNQSYSVRDNSGRLIVKVPISHLKLLSRVPIVNPRIPESFQASDATSHEVKSILAHNVTGDSIDYLVQWKDSKLSSSWVPAKDFDDPKLIRSYWKSLGTKEPEPRPKLKVRFKLPTKA
jgi:hypothetical protein